MEKAPAARTTRSAGSVPAELWDRRDASALLHDRRHLGLQELAAALDQRLDDALDIALGMADGPVVRQQQAARDLGVEGRLQVQHLVPAEQLEVTAAPAEELPLERGRALEAIGIEGDLEPAARAHEVGEAALLDDEIVGLLRALGQGRYRLRGGLGALGAGGQRHAQEPGQQARQMAPADRERAQRVAQHGRHLADEPWCGDRQHAGDADDAGIAERGAAAGRPRVDQAHAPAVALEKKGAAGADDTGADDQRRAGCGFAHPSSMAAGGDAGRGCGAGDCPAAGNHLD